ncbi:hypothetical protein LAZ67_17001903 [Cordylochernes scorpioides]|uniref:Uncharacterized protein n=1 Tax=Cordylochernes scorpioides TaxID=51811 RepID=A0ABY6LDZ7_9ARAC|nr:hypothetical protein LAZ67_17001903 [Cordylochernes scorpioides]
MEAPLKDCTTLEQRAVIRFLNAEGIQTSQICQRMKNIYEHPAYSPDLAPSDYFLFGLLKKELKGKRFDSDEDVQKVLVSVSAMSSFEQMANIKFCVKLKKSSQRH